MRAWLVAACVCIPGLAAAEPDVTFRMLDHERIAATVSGGPRVPASDLTLATADATARASDIRDYAASGEPLALALVINGQEIWIGNDDVEPEDSPAHYPGALKGLERALDRVPLAAQMPAGSEATVVSYATGARVLLHGAPLAELTGAALGAQSDYYTKIGFDLVQGIELATSELSHSRAARKVMIVIGDGNDTNNDVAKVALAELRHDAAVHQIETYAIIYKSVISADTSVIPAFTSHITVVNSADGMAAALANIATRIADRYEVTFDASALPWDGNVHELEVRVAGEPIASQDVRLPSHVAPRPWWQSRELLELAVGTLLAAGLLALWRLRALSSGVA